MYYVVTASGVDHGSYLSQTEAAAKIGFNGWPKSKILTQEECDKIKDLPSEEKQKMLETVGKRVNY